MCQNCPAQFPLRGAHEETRNAKYSGTDQQGQWKKLKKVTLTRQVTHYQLEEFLDNLKKSGQQPKTLNARSQFIKALFNFAVEESYVTVNPSQRI